MKTFVTFASQVRLHAVLCSAAVLLSACGGGADTGNGQQLLAAEVAANPAVMSPAATANVAAQAQTPATADAVPAAAPADQAAMNSVSAMSEAASETVEQAASVNAETTASPAAGAIPPAANFDLSGYQPAEPLSAADAGQAAQAPQ